MNEMELIVDELRQKISDFLVPIQTSRIIQEDKFKSVQLALELLASKLKGVDLISKSLLNEIYVTVKIIRAEAPGFKGDESKLMDMANKLEYIFELILKNESADQRKPGIPRIV